MVGLAFEEIQGLERALSRSLPGPDELFSFRFGNNLFSFNAGHAPALAADKGRIHAGVKIVLFNANG